MTETGGAEAYSGGADLGKEDEVQAAFHGVRCCHGQCVIEEEPFVFEDGLLALETGCIADVVKRGEIIDLVVTDFLNEDMEVVERQDGFWLFLPYSVGDCTDLRVKAAASEGAEVGEPAFGRWFRTLGLKLLEGDREGNEGPQCSAFCLVSFLLVGQVVCVAGSQCGRMWEYALERYPILRAQGGEYQRDSGALFEAGGVGARRTAGWKNL
jgi:hypothetical protein